MDFTGFINSFTKIAAVISVKVNPDGSFSEICNEAANDAYLKSVNIERKDLCQLIIGCLFMKMICQLWKH